MASRRIRNPLLRTLYEHQTDERFQRSCLRKFHNVEMWYKCDTSKIPEWLSSKFVQCSCDRSTELFLDNSYDKSDWLVTQLWHSVAKGILSFFMSTTSINGFLQRGLMYVFSQDQFMQLLQVDSNWKTHRLLDLGAGDGEVTKEMETFFSEIYATEVSWPMQWRLSSRGYTILPISEWSHEKSGRTYDVISCLNLLDRCDRPITLLEDMRNSSSPGGVVIVAVVLPFKQYVEIGTQENKPLEEINVKGQTWEEQALSLVEDVFIPAGFQVKSFSHVPYLCEGDSTTPFYTLDDAVFVLEVKDDTNDDLPQQDSESTCPDDQ